ncbi:organoarsenical effux MFS transporter ArsJ [Planktotalea sp.]|uniref:organoarsenical effux MFS transporter ArsJ n=1 Tax=Planktotalea sp. TaxID=2029877 RepID=UPI0025E2D8AA|nr:organoarsenical effux MFS transporter ArsJ [Planktotalea sp.]
MTRPAGFAAYLAVTAAYWAFMLTDGALRMLVLLHFHALGFSPVQLAYLFVLYEITGVVTNLCAGWLALRFGLSATLYAGLGLQIVALLALTQLDSAWGTFASVAFVMCVQGLSGVAKDLAKMSSKSAVKLLAPSEGDALFKWVAVLTGSKNAVKGLGFLLGATLLAVWGFEGALLGMAVALALVFTGVAWNMPGGLPTGIKGTKFSAVFSTDANVNWLSLARVFLFGARDVWFVVGIPIYFYAIWSDGSEESNKAAFFLIGSFMALWVIFYGIVQGFAPRVLSQLPVQSASGLAGVLALVPIVLGALVWLDLANLTPVLIVGLFLFGALFALNSALHSYLILRFTTAERVTMDVGFYYMANASGRLLGTVLSGLSYQLGGLALCLFVAGGMLVFSALAARKLPVVHLS